MKLSRLCQLSLLLVSCLVYCSCNDDADTVNGPTNGELAALTIKTDISPALRNTKSGTISSFTDDSQLGLFISQDGNIDHVFERYGTGRNVCSIYKYGYWYQQPGVMLDNIPVRVFAYYPFNQENHYPRQIPVEHTSQTDYLYGTHATGWAEVNKYNPEVKLAMKHALSLVQFHISGPGADYVDYIEIVNPMPGVIGLHSRGTLDISTGEISYDESSREGIRWQNDGTHYAGSQEGINMMVMPTAVTTAGSVAVHFKIEGEPYTWIVPEGTSWKSGTRNTYHMQITGKELHVRDVVIEPWLPGINETYPL
ncbi:fimbrillin family protein [Dysgonomonas sp. 216]|uniref:fimbrillin family protein n=1 Tax=Dysgonomonas sp. 216 TaxID=2302934 RepID=UPI0013D6D4AB|nr:fimbrillin family protein [Dysgonomonas sp. 216]NDW18771.1 fimbrillin family protein [Dysgonomonas sp. 216]